MSTATNGLGSHQSAGGATAAISSAVPLPPPRAPVLRGRRRPAMVALGVALMALGALTAVWLVNAAGHRVSVLAVARNVPFGSVVTEADITRAEVSVDATVATVPSAAVDQVIGRIAATELRRGALLSPDAVTDAAPPRVGQVLVPLALAPTRLPAGALRAGDRLLVIDAPRPDADVSASPIASIAATVVRQGDPDVNGVTVLDVTVATGDGPALAAWSATGRAAIVVRPRGDS